MVPLCTLACHPPPIHLVTVMNARRVEGNNYMGGRELILMLNRQVLSARMAMEPGVEGRLDAAAVHFLKHNDQRRLEPVRIVKSIAFQLAKR